MGDRSAWSDHYESRQRLKCLLETGHTIVSHAQMQHNPAQSCLSNSNAAQPSTPQHCAVPKLSMAEHSTKRVESAQGTYRVVSWDTGVGSSGLLPGQHCCAPCHQPIPQVTAWAPNINLRQVEHSQEAETMSKQADVFVRDWLCIQVHSNYFSDQDHGNDMSSVKCVHACLQK